MRSAIEGRPTNRRTDVGGWSTVWWNSVAGQLLQGIVLEFGMSIHWIPNSGRGRKSEGDARNGEVFGNGSWTR